MLHIAQNDRHRRDLILRQGVDEPVVTIDEWADWQCAQYLSRHPEIQLESGQLDGLILNALKGDQFLNVGYLGRVRAIWQELDAAGVVELLADDGSNYYLSLCRIYAQVRKQLSDADRLTRSMLIYRVMDAIQSGEMAAMGQRELIIHDAYLMGLAQRRLIDLDLGRHTHRSPSKGRATLSPQGRGVNYFENEDAEVRGITSDIHAIRKENPQAKIAIIISSFKDTRKYQKGLDALGFSVRNHFSKSFSENPGAKLLLTVLDARIHGLTLDKLASILLNPAQVHWRVSYLQVSGLLQNLKHAGAKDEHEDIQNGRGNFLEQLSKLYDFENREDETSKLRLNVLRWIQALMESIPDVVDGIGLEDISGIIGGCVQKIPEDSYSTREANAIDLIGVDAAQWQQWDVVFVPGFSLGSYPTSKKQDEVFSDDRRVWLNGLRAVPLSPAALPCVRPSPTSGEGKNPLILDDEALFMEEGQETRASIEYKKLQKLIEQSREIYFSIPKEDVRGNILEPSPFLAKLGELEKVLVVYRHPHPSRSKDRAPLSPQGRGVISKDLVRGRFAKAFGIDPERPLSPTALELFATCKFRGFSERALKIKLDRDSGNDVDVMWLGTLAHAVLEAFYKERITNRVINRFDQEDRERLNFIFHATAQKHRNKYLNPNDGVLDVTLKWLKDVLMRLVRKLERDVLVDGVWPAFVEKKLGFSREEELSSRMREDSRSESAHSTGPSGLDINHKSSPSPRRITSADPLPRGERGKIRDDRSISFQWGKDRIYLRGIVDRVDIGPRARLVMDYKMSNSMVISDKVRSGNLMAKHFQIPLYLWLLEQANPTDSNVDLLGCLVSIKDAAVSRIVGIKDEDFRERIADGSREDSLEMAMGRVISPLLAGDIGIEAGSHCDFCQLAPACRRHDV